MRHDPWSGPQHRLAHLWHQWAKYLDVFVRGGNHDDVDCQAGKLLLGLSDCFDLVAGQLRAQGRGKALVKTTDG